MSVVASIEDVGPWRKRLTVEVPAPAVDAETARVVREYGQRVRIPGFRRGKVPADLVRRRFAKDIDQEVMDRLLPRYWRQAQAESEIEPLLAPEVEEVREREAGGPLTFVATVETRPHIELRNLHDFELPNPAIEPGELDVDKALDDLRIRFGEWVPVTRPAARGDLVAAQISEVPEAPPMAPMAPVAPDTAEPAAAPESGDPVEFEVGDPRVWEELSLAVSGLGEGQETTFVREAAPAGDPDAPAPLAPTSEPAPTSSGATPGRPRRFRIRVNAVKERELPALDDELAARINPELGGLQALRDLVTGRLRQARSEERLEARRRALLEQLRDRHPFELPQGVVQREIERIAEDYAESLNRRGTPGRRGDPGGGAADAPDLGGIDWQRFRQEARPHAERMVHDRLLLDAISASEGVEVSAEEFERALAGLARVQRTTTPALRKALDESGRLESLREHMRRDKTVRHLLGEDEPTHAAPATPATPANTEDVSAPPHSRDAAATPPAPEPEVVAE